MVLKVQNIAGTGSNARPISSWLEYWEKVTGRKADHCMAYEERPFGQPNLVYPCSNKTNLVGGHVMKVNSDDRRWYILPICTSHNQQANDYWAREEDLVLEN